MVNSAIQAPFLRSSLIPPSYQRAIRHTFTFRINKLSFPLILAPRPYSSIQEAVDLAPLVLSYRSHSKLDVTDAPLVLSYRPHSKPDVADAPLTFDYRPYSESEVVNKAPNSE